MRWPQFQSSWALWIGFLIAPLACALNAALLEHFVSDSPLKIGEWFPLGIVMSFITGPQGGVSYAILDLWKQGKHRAARGLSAFCGVVAPLFWLWVWHGLELKMQWGFRHAAPAFGALILPALWGCLFLIFPILARPPKK